MCHPSHLSGDNSSVIYNGHLPATPRHTSRTLRFADLKLCPLNNYHSQHCGIYEFDCSRDLIRVVQSVCLYFT